LDFAYRIYAASNSLSLTQAALGARGYNLADTMVLNSLLEGAALYVRSIVDSNFISDFVTQYSDTPCVTKTNNYAEPSKPTQSGKGLVLQSKTGLEVRLRSPERDDKNRVSFDRVNRETLGGELNVYRDPTWPIINSLLFTVISIKSSALLDLQHFIAATLGQPIKLTDWTGDTWIGVITNPDEAAVEDRINGWTLAFEFEGVLVEGSAPGSSLSITQSVSYTIE
jgi:hypothetical protein